MTSQVNHQCEGNVTGRPEANTQQAGKQKPVRLARDIERASLASSTTTAQDGVQRIEAVSMTWTRWGLVFTYIGIFLMAFTTSLEGQVTYPLSVFATSSFYQHSLVATVLVIQQVVNAVIKPPMAKIADVFGRLEAFSFSVLLYLLGLIQMAASSNVETYAAAQIFYSAGGTGLQILQQVLIADTSDLLNRAFWSSLPDIPFLITVWIGPIISQSIYQQSGWRWGYGIWIIIMPATFLLLALSLFPNQRKASKMGLLPPSAWKNIRQIHVLKNVLFELDVGGILLLSAAFALILIPFTIAAKQDGGWHNGSIIAMLVVGLICLIGLPLWESGKKLAPRPLIPIHLLKNRTFCAGCGIGLFYFMVFYLSVQPYFYSYLLVVQQKSITDAGHITMTFSFTSTVASITISLIIKYTKHYKYYVFVGSLIYMMGIGLMIRYRTEDSTVAQIVGAQIAVGIGGGMLNVLAQLGVQASCSHQEVAAATAVYLTVVEIGGAVGAAISGAVWTKLIPQKLAEYLPTASKGQAQAIFNDISVAVGFAVGTPERTAINQAYQETMNTLLIIAICVAIPLVPFALIMKNYTLNRMDQKVKGRVMGGIVDDEWKVDGGRNWWRGRVR